MMRSKNISVVSRLCVRKYCLIFKDMCSIIKKIHYYFCIKTRQEVGTGSYSDNHDVYPSANSRSGGFPEVAADEELAIAMSKIIQK